MSQQAHYITQNTPVIKVFSDKILYTLCRELPWTYNTISFSRRQTQEQRTTSTTAKLSVVLRELHLSLNSTVKLPDKKRLQAKLHELSQELGSSDE